MLTGDEIIHALVKNLPVKARTAQALIITNPFPHLPNLVNPEKTTFDPLPAGIRVLNKQKKILPSKLPFLHFNKSVFVL
jgi:hypothetical protein